MNENEPLQYKIINTIQSIISEGLLSNRSRIRNIPKNSKFYEAFKNAQESYNIGVMTQFDFDLVRNRLVNAEGAIIRAKYDYIFKMKVLEFYKGQGITL